MADVDWNVYDNRAEAFKAFLQFTISGDNNRYKTLGDVTMQYDWLDEDRYTDDGKLVLVRVGQANLVTIAITLDANQFDTANPPTNAKTLSYFIYQKNSGSRVQIAVIQVFETEATTNKFLRHSFTMDLQRIGTVRRVGGVVEVVLEGRILDTVLPTNIRSAS